VKEFHNLETLRIGAGAGKANFGGREGFLPEFSQSSSCHFGHHFCSFFKEFAQILFVKVFRDFARILPDFKGFARIFIKSKLLGCACTPASYTSDPTDKKMLKAKDFL